MKKVTKKRTVKKKKAKIIIPKRVSFKEFLKENKTAIYLNEYISHKVINSNHDIEILNLSQELHEVASKLERIFVMNTVPALKAMCREER